MRGKEEILEHINAFVREYQKGDSRMRTAPIYEV